MEIGVTKTTKNGGEVIIKIDDKTYRGGWHCEDYGILLDAFTAEDFAVLDDNRAKIEEVVKNIEDEKESA